MRIFRKKTKRRAKACSREFMQMLVDQRKDAVYYRDILGAEVNENGLRPKDARYLRTPSNPFVPLGKPDILVEFTYRWRMNP